MEIKESQRNVCNSSFSKSIEAMEAGKPAFVVRDLLLETSDALVKLSKIDSALCEKAIAKAKLLLKCATTIRETSSYDSVYTQLTGHVLAKKALEVKKTEEIQKPVKKEEKAGTPNDVELGYKFEWDSLPTVSFDDVAGLHEVKEEVKNKVIMPLVSPELYEGYDKKNGGGLLLYGPPGTGKTMIAAAIAREIGAKFCCIGASDLLSTGVGNTEKAIAELFKEARSFKCSVIFFDEVEALCPATTHAQVARQVRSELLRQMQGLESYGKQTENILYLIGATNKPWDLDPAFVRPGRFGTRVYVGLPDDEARKHMIESKLFKIRKSGKVAIEEINIDEIIEATKGFNGADMSYLLDEVQEVSISRASSGNNKTISMDDFRIALGKISSSVQTKDIEKLNEWEEVNG